MGDISLDSGDQSIYSFLRLVGCTYFRQHASAFPLQTPEALFHSIKDSTSCLDHHNKWLAKIRGIIRQRVDTNNKLLPSSEALQLHWKRCLWVLGMWHCASLNIVEVPGEYDKALV